MDDDDFRALIELLEEELRAVGAGDIADQRHYLQDGEGDGEPRLLDPQRRLIEMLRAFERKLAIEDRGLHDAALDRMNRVLRGEGPWGAVLELTGEAGREAVLIDLGRAPDLGALREETRYLIGRIAESRSPPRSPA